MWELDHKEEWVPKNWCFQIVVLERLLRVPWTAKRSNQSILREINPEYSLEGLMLKLKLQYFAHLMRTAGSLEKHLMLGKTEGRRRRGGQEQKGAAEDEMVGQHRWFDGHELGRAPGDGEEQTALAAVHGVTKNQAWLSNWTPPPSTTTLISTRWSFLNVHVSSELTFKAVDKHYTLEKEMATHSSILGSGLENLLDRGSWRATVHDGAVVEHVLATKQKHHKLT